MRTSFHLDRNGNAIPEELDEFGRPKKRIVGDGESIVVGMTFMDSAPLSDNALEMARLNCDAAYVESCRRLNPHHAPAGAAIADSGIGATSQSSFDAYRKSVDDMNSWRTAQ